MSKSTGIGFTTLLDSRLTMYLPVTECTYCRNNVTPGRTTCQTCGAPAAPAEPEPDPAPAQ